MESQRGRQDWVHNTYSHISTRDTRWQTWAAYWGSAMLHCCDPPDLTNLLVLITDESWCYGVRVESRFCPIILLGSQVLDPISVCVCVPVCMCACTYTLLGYSPLIAVPSKLQHCLLKSNDYNLSRALRLTNFIPIISFDHHNKLEDIDIPSVSQFSRSVVSDSLWPHGLQRASLPYPSPAPTPCSNSWPWSQWCHPTISSSVVPFSCLQSFPTSGSFPVNQLFTSGGQSIGVSASTSVLPMNTQDWSPLG